MSEDLSVRELEATDRDRAVAVVDLAAEWYAEFLPPEETTGPEMSPEQWEVEAERMTWYGAFAGDRLVGVMGAEYVRDVVLLRHAYVLPDWQRRGIGSTLREHIESLITGVDRVIVGTYAENYKARSALERGGYRLSEDCQAVLCSYYDIPEDRLRSSVTYEKSLTG